MMKQLDISHIDFHTILSGFGQFLVRGWIPIVELLVGFILGPLVKKMLMKAAKKAPDKGILTFLGSCASALIITISILLAFEQLGIRTTSIVALVSALGLGISLALKSNMANVAGGLQILLTKPFEIGDYISIQGKKGRVTSIELMFTTLLTNNNREIIVPNNEIVTNLLVNYSKMPCQRLKLTISVTLPNDIAQAKKEIEAIVSKDPRILKDPPMRVCVDHFYENYAYVCVFVYVKGKDFEPCKYDLYYNITSQISAFKKDPQQSDS